MSGGPPTELLLKPDKEIGRTMNSKNSFIDNWSWLPFAIVAYSVAKVVVPDNAVAAIICGIVAGALGSMVVGNIRRSRGR